MNALVYQLNSSAVKGGFLHGSHINLTVSHGFLEYILCKTEVWRQQRSSFSDQSL